MAARQSIDLEQDPRAIIAVRIYEAPRALVWQAWSDPQHLARWWGPNGFRTTTAAFAFRPGGAWRFVMHGPDGRDYQNRIVYDEIIEPERIVYHHDGHGDDIGPVEFRVAVTFEALDARTTKLSTRMVFPSAAERARVIAHGADTGLAETLERLDWHVRAADANHAGGVPLAPSDAHTVTISREFDAPRELVWKTWTEPAHMAQ